MFNHYVGSGADLFILIVAVIVGFAAALGYVDFLRTSKKEEKPE